MQDFIRNIILKLFGRLIYQSEQQLGQALTDKQRYEDTRQENITALLAGKVANIAFGDAQVAVASDAPNAFSDLLNNIAAREFVKVKHNIAAGLGIGMIVSIPYSVDSGLGRRIYIDTVTKERFFISSMQGGDITGCVILAEEITRERKVFKRWADYSIENGVYTIRNRATRDSSPVPLDSVEEWALIPEEIRIGGVKRLPVAVFKCPQNPRRTGGVEGVPITYGCDATLKKIASTLNDIEREYEKKKAKIFADRSLIRKRREADEEGDTSRFAVRSPASNGFDDRDLFVAFNSTDRLGVDIFDPDIRDGAYYNKLAQHFAMLEKECGLSEGVITKLQTAAATATEIRRAMYDTFCFCDDIHKNFQQYFDDLIYGCEVLINFYGLAPYADYNVSYSWSYALIEDSLQTFSQLMQAESIGAERTAEIRRFNHPDESLEEAQAVIDEIAEMRKQQMMPVITNEDDE